MGVGKLREISAVRVDSLDRIKKWRSFEKEEGNG